MSNRVKRAIAALYALLTIVMSTIGAVLVVAYAASSKQTNLHNQYLFNSL